MDLLFSGLDVIIIPSIIIIIAAPAVLLRVLFSSFFAPHVINRVKSFEDLVGLIYTMNLDKYEDLTGELVLKQLLIINQKR
ncbi:hypothetical protein BFP71_06650 [Roseivirga misakiensis]|uniref:Uncharacterized protein n=1 Tax=Roseivirga misakiensis TaxID=1563681 RepID=A0A1E5T328_9BACT|nr:hypothetical protein BFP71_06650 [Roseivirga misakiensis]